MTLQQFAQSLRDAANALRTEAPNIVRRSGMDAVATVERRIKEQGIPGKSYKSKGKVPYFGGSKGFGAKKDYATHGKVDLTLTNRMWNGISVLGTVQVREGVYRAQIGGTDKEVDGKLLGNINRYGDFLQPNEQEQEELLDDSAADVMDIIRRHIT